MTQSEINTRLILVAAGKRTHPYYTRTVELARKYTALSTGVGIEKYMKMYSRREDANLFKVRCEITQQITPSILSRLSAVREKAYRSHYRREVSYGSEEMELAKSSNFENDLSRYAGGMGVDGYCQDRLLELNLTDPNTWVIQEWKDFNNYQEFAEPYPFEASSEMAIDFAFERGTLQYLTVDVGEGFTCYQRNFSSTLKKTGEKAGVSLEPPTELVNGERVLINGEYWIYQEYYHHLGEIKAKRVGYKRDKITAGNTFVWPYEAAEPYLMKSLKVVSELDLTAANVAFPITARYADACNAPGCGGSGWVDNMVCGSCKGTGHKTTPTSVMEEIVVSPMPTSPDNMLDLSKLFTHISPDVSILSWQQAYVQELEEKCIAADLNSEMYNKKEIQQTATGKSIDQQNANDVVYKYFRFYAEFWQFTVFAIADIMAKSDGLNAQIIVSKDLKLKTINELMDDLKQANDAGAGPATRQAIEWDIMRIVSTDSPHEFEEWEVKERFNPFSGYTEDQKMVWAQSPLIPFSQRVLYANLGYIFDQLEFNNPKFYKMPYAEQKALVDAKVAEITATLQSAAAPTIAV